MHSTVSKMMKGMTKTVREKRIVHTSVQDLSMIGSRTFSLSLGPEPYLQPPWTKGNRIVEADRRRNSLIMRSDCKEVSYV